MRKFFAVIVRWCLARSPPLRTLLLLVIGRLVSCKLKSYLHSIPLRNVLI